MNFCILKKCKYIFFQKNKLIFLINIFLQKFSRNISNLTILRNIQIYSIVYKYNIFLVYYIVIYQKHFLSKKYICKKLYIQKLYIQISDYINK